jgi:rhamnogalacturonyl hydrolase YesR
MPRTVDRSTDVVLGEVVDASASLPTTIWGFGVGGFLHALVRAGCLLDRPALVAEVRQRVAPAVSRGAQPDDHLIPVEVLLALDEVEPLPGVQETCRRWADTVSQAPRVVPGQPRVHRPDLERWHGVIWVDCMHTDGPGLSRLGRVEEGVATTVEYASALQRDDGLFQHGYDVIRGGGNEVAWGRGQAWAMLGLLGTLRHAAAPELSERLAAQLTAVSRYEDDGRWHTVVDDPASPFENSVSAYMAWLVPQAVAGGLADDAAHDLARRARTATLAALDQGRLAVSDATPIAAPQAYRDRPTGVHPWGQAPVLALLLDELTP